MAGLSGAARLIIGAARVQLGVTRAAARALLAADGFVAGALDAALSEPEKSALGVALYDASPRYRAADGLRPWEARWYDADLPPAPARVLVAACGAGRELVALRERGYDVSGYEPAASLVAEARRRVPDAAVEQLDFDGWIDAAATGATALGGPFDAVVLGWGSVSHVLGDDGLRRLFVACAAACPAGPILVSHWPERTNAPSAARRAGERLGRGLAAARGGEAAPSGVAFDPTIGFARGVSDGALEAAAAAAGRRFVRRGGAGDYPHGTILGAENRD